MRPRINRKSRKDLGFRPPGQSLVAFVCTASTLLIVLIYLSVKSAPINHEQAGRIHHGSGIRHSDLQLHSFADEREYGIATGPYLKNQVAGLRIAWLLSFPNSGTSYTSRLVRDTSQTMSASNYADETPTGETGFKEPVFLDQPTGPFWVIPEATPHHNKPINFVLTKTHCGIRCNPCGPEVMAETTYSFRRRCFVTKWTRHDGRHQYSTYAPDRVTKAVHIFRNPFDNVVSRFHLHNKNTGSKFSDDKEGFLKYCLSIDYLYTDSETKYMHFNENKLLSALWLVPCHADFLRFVEWHNLASFVQNDLQLETLCVHYEDFGDQVKSNLTLTRLLDFLLLERRAELPPFISGKSYTNYFTLKEKLTVKHALHFAASRETWLRISHYFPSEMD